MMLKTIDLFAGAGGLSLGFQQTGKFEIVAAAEINKNARKTYQRNISADNPDFIFINNDKNRIDTLHTTTHNYLNYINDKVETRKT